MSDFKLQNPRLASQNLQSLRDSIEQLNTQELDALESAMRLLQTDISNARERLEQTPPIPLGGYWPRLPAEICSLIFEFVVSPSDDMFRIELGVPEMDPPVILCLVSRRWRDIACSSPRLWSLVSLAGHDFPLPRASLWLSRNKAAPVQIYFDMCKMLSETPPQLRELFVHDAMTLIAKHIPHCQCLSISTDEPKWIPIILSQLQQRAPLLSHFSINFVDQEGVLAPLTEEDDLELTRLSQARANTLFANASPMLTFGHFISLGIIWPSSALNNLTTLEISHGGFTSLRRVLDMFQLFPAVTSLSISDWSLGPPGFSMPVVVNTTIQHLDIASPEGDNISTLLNMLDLPSLRSLKIKSEQGSLTYSGVQPRQFSSIISLDIDCPVDDVAAGYPVFDRMENLRTLVVAGIDIIALLTDPVLKARDGGGFSRQMLFPMLADLTVHHDDPVELEDSLHNFLGRQGGAVPLKLLHFSPFKNVDKHIIHNLERDGLEIDTLW